MAQLKIYNGNDLIFPPFNNTQISAFNRRLFGSDMSQLPIIQKKAKVIHLLASNRMLSEGDKCAIDDVIQKVSIDQNYSSFPTNCFINAPLLQLSHRYIFNICNHCQLFIFGLFVTLSIKNLIKGSQKVAQAKSYIMKKKVSIAQQ